MIICCDKCDRLYTVVIEFFLESSVHVVKALIYPYDGK